MRYDPSNLSIADIRRRFDDAAASFNQADYVHRATSEGLIDRLSPIKIDPQLILDLGAATGKSGRELSTIYRKATIVSLDASAGMLKAATKSRRFFSKYKRLSLQADAGQIPLRTGSVDLVFCNMMLPWVADLTTCFADVARVLRKGGVFAFSTLGPDSMMEFREAWSRIGETDRVHVFPDMHVVGDALVQAGLADPVLDIDRLTITYPSNAELLDDLNSCGASIEPFWKDPLPENLSRLKIMMRDFQNHQDRSDLSLDLELVYGHAWGSGPRPKPGEYRIEPGSIGRLDRP